MPDAVKNAVQPSRGAGAPLVHRNCLQFRPSGEDMRTQEKVLPRQAKPAAKTLGARSLCLLGELAATATARGSEEDPWPWPVLSAIWGALAE